MDLSSTIRPTLLVNETICRNNIRRMAQKARLAHIQFRPHFKTHQNLTIGRWYRDEGIEKITVSSVLMAQKFAADGWNDITIAVPVNLREVSCINQIPQSVQLQLLLEDETTAQILDKKLERPVRIFIKIDTGYHRTGIPADDFDKIERVITAITHSQHLALTGILSHSGHTYNTSSPTQIEQIHHLAVKQMNRIKNRFNKHNLLISLGDTPAFSQIENLSGIDEMRPGNFVFYDLMQHQLGSCKKTNIAVLAVCPVVALHPQRNEVVIYGGGVHLSKEFLISSSGKHQYGHLALLTKNGWEHLPEENYLSRLSQEHGIAHISPATEKQIKAGDLLGIVPIHACMTANLLPDFHFIQA